MSDRPTPMTFDPYPWNQNGPGRSHRPEVMYPCDDGEWVKLDDYRDLERKLAEAREALEKETRRLDWLDTQGKPETFEDAPHSMVWVLIGETEHAEIREAIDEALARIDANGASPENSPPPEESAKHNG